MATALPFLKWFPRDWMADSGVRSMSLAARGLWFDMLNLMHLSPKRGQLLTPTGFTFSTDQLARSVGSTPGEVSALLAELESTGVFSRDAAGVIYSRRMVGEADRWEACRANGRKGGNPKLLGKSDGGLTSDANPRVKELRSSEVQIEEKKKNPPTPHGGEETPTKPATTPAKKGDPAAVPIPPSLDGPTFRAVWAEWFADRAARRKPVTDRAARQQLAALAPLGQQLAADCVAESIRNGWTGLFPERFTGPRGVAGQPLDRSQAQTAAVFSQIEEAKRIHAQQRTGPDHPRGALGSRGDARGPEPADADPRGLG